MSLTQQALENVHAILAEADAKLDKLRQIGPCLIDLSLRENPVGSNVGQTLARKLVILPRPREIGFRIFRWASSTTRYRWSEAPR